MLLVCLSIVSRETILKLYLKLLFISNRIMFHVKHYYATLLMNVSRETFLIEIFV